MAHHVEADSPRAVLRVGTRGLALEVDRRVGEVVDSRCLCVRALDAHDGAKPEKYVFHRKFAKKVAKRAVVRVQFVCILFRRHAGE